MDLIYLNEEQNSEFDYDYHHEDEFDHKLTYLKKTLPDRPIRILDVGGGNGRFMDRLLDEFPSAEGYVLDISEGLLKKNSPHPRKHLVHGSFEDLSTLIPTGDFDVVTVNWVLHHLVGSSYAESIRNMEQALKLAANALGPNGVIYVAENEYDGYFGTNFPARIIYRITRITNPGFVRLASRYFNTAGVGVCFQSHNAWKKLFDRFGYAVDDYFRFDRWHHPFKKRLMFAGIGLRGQFHGHFVLRRARLA